MGAGTEPLRSGSRTVAGRAKPPGPAEPPSLERRRGRSLAPWLSSAAVAARPGWLHTRGSWASRGAAASSRGKVAGPRAADGQATNSPQQHHVGISRLRTPRLVREPRDLGQPCQPTGLAGFPQEQHSRPRETRQSWVAWDMEASDPGGHRRTSKGQSPSGAGGQAGKERRPGREAGSWGGGRECQTLAGWPAWRGTPLLPAPG